MEDYRIRRDKKSGKGKQKKGLKLRKCGHYSVYHRLGMCPSCGQSETIRRMRAEDKSNHRFTRNTNE